MIKRKSCFKIVAFLLNFLFKIERHSTSKKAVFQQVKNHQK